MHVPNTPSHLDNENQVLGLISTLIKMWLDMHY